MKNSKLIGIFLLVMVGLYLTGWTFYQDKFMANTAYADIDISQLTYDEALAKIKQEMQHSFTIRENGDVIGQFTLAEVGGEVKVDKELQERLALQQTNYWPLAWLNGQRISVKAEEAIAIDSNQLEAILKSESSLPEERQAPSDAYLDYDVANGFYIKVEENGNQIDFTQAVDAVYESISQGNHEIELANLYTQAKVTQGDEGLAKQLERIQKASQAEITLTIAGFEEEITPERIQSWLVFEDDGDYYFDDSLIYDYLGELNDKYATYDDYRQFQSTLQGEVTVIPGILGWSIDRPAETEAILADLQAGAQVTREVTIAGTGYNGYNLDDIGSSYIEVDILNQMMFMYLDGEQVLSTPVVTGQTGTDTIPGANAIWNMETPSALVGYNPRTEQDYVQPVDYWMAFDDQAQGIHDANWQPSFGGDNYLYNGSLGCVNTPPDIMPVFFELAYPGMPVIVF